MKLLTGLIFLNIIAGCWQSSGNRETMILKEKSNRDAIIDPVVPYNFELYYNKMLKVSPNIFPRGVDGTGVLRVFVNNDSKVGKFEIVSIKIRNDGNLIYDYATDSKSRKTQQLDTVLRSFVKGIRVDKIRDTLLADWEPYVVGIRFE